MERKGELLYQRFLNTAQETVRLTAALEGFFLEADIEESQRDAYAAYLKRRIRPAMERLIRAGKIFESNTGAISRGYRQTPYPAEPLLRLLREMDGKILFTADAHRACDVAFGYAEAVELACRCGFDTFWRLTEEGFVPAPLHRALT